MTFADFKERYLHRMDWALLAAVVGLSLFGVVILFSALSRQGTVHLFVGKQIFALALGMALAALLLTFRYQILQAPAPWLYIISLILLLALLFVGHRIHGARSWFTFGGFSFQPAELAKMTLILCLGWLISRPSFQEKPLSSALLACGLTALPMGLVLLQPDLSSSLVFPFILLGILWASGISAFWLISLAVIGLVSMGLPLAQALLKSLGKTEIDFLRVAMIILLFEGLIFAGAWLARSLRLLRTPAKALLPCGLFLGALVVGTFTAFALDATLKPYQKMRLAAFVDPSLDPFGAGYNIIQSKIAIGSGRIFGKGLFSGTQSQLGFIPEQHTDFIFPVIAEEMGAVGGILVLLAYAVICLRALAISQEATDRFGAGVALGAACMFFFYVVTNLGMTMGVLPVTGVPLPFLSYGGSALVANWAAVGLLLNIHIRRFAN